jgi:hypothetical protein
MNPMPTLSTLSAAKAAVLTAAARIMAAAAV